MKLVWEKLLSRGNSIFMDSMKLFGSSHITIDLDYDYRVKNYKIVNGVNYVAPDWDKYIDNLYIAYQKDNHILENIYESGRKDIKGLQKYWQKIKATDLDKASDKEVKKIFDDYINSLYELMAYLFIPLFADRIITDNLKKIITKYAGPEKVNDLMPILTAPETMSATQEEAVDFLQMVKKMRNNKKQNDRLIQKHLDKWAWLADHNYAGGFWTTQYIKEKINELKDKDPDLEIKHIKDEIKNAKTKYQQVVKGWQLTISEKNMIDLAKKFVFFRTFRLDALFYSEFLVQNLWKKISKKTNLPYGQLMMLAPWEISSALEGEQHDFTRILKERKKLCVILLQNYEVSIYSGKQAEKFVETIDENQKPSNIKGQTAFKGVVKGKVRIIMDKTKFSKFKDNEILVTGMTTPDFVPLMKRCSAIITDEGGITCHAAIVSREMKKPCIIGTKVATQILKNGDQVEVDANRATIKILK